MKPLDLTGLPPAVVAELPELRLFGFTARHPSTAIGSIIADMNGAHPDRCRIRFSGTDQGGVGAQVIATQADSRHVVCPVQTGKTDCCGTCALCWSMDRPVEFVRH